MNSEDQLHIRVPTDLREALKKASKAKRTNVSEMIRQLLFKTFMKGKAS